MKTSKLVFATLALGDVHRLFADALNLVLELDGERCDFGVLALGAKRIRFAAHFLEDKPEVLALSATFGERVEEELVVAPKSRDFFVDVELVGHDAGFLQKADFVDFGILHERIDAFAELDLPRFDALRIEDFDLVDDFVQVENAAGEVGGKVRPFLFAHGDDSIQSLVEFGLQMLFPHFVVAVAICELQNVGNGEHVFELDFTGDAVLLLHGLRDFDELGNGSFVVADGNVPGIASAKRNGQVHGTANELVLNLSLEVVFEISEVLRHLA